MRAAAVILTRWVSVMPISCKIMGSLFRGAWSPWGLDSDKNRDEVAKCKFTNIRKQSISKMDGSSGNAGCSNKKPIHKYYVCTIAHHRLIPLQFVRYWRYFVCADTCGRIFASLPSLTSAFTVFSCREDRVSAEKRNLSCCRASHSRGIIVIRLTCNKYLAVPKLEIT